MENQSTGGREGGRAGGSQSNKELVGRNNKVVRWVRSLRWLNVGMDAVYLFVRSSVHSSGVTLRMDVVRSVMVHVTCTTPGGAGTAVPPSWVQHREDSLCVQQTAGAGDTPNKNKKRYGCTCATRANIPSPL